MSSLLQLELEAKERIYGQTTLLLVNCDLSPDISFTDSTLLSTLIHCSKETRLRSLCLLCLSGAYILWEGWEQTAMPHGNLEGIKNGMMGIN